MITTLTYETWNEAESHKLISQFRDPLDVLKWAYSTFGDEVVYACSFGAEGIVLLDLIYKVNKTADIIFLETGLHFQETYKLIDIVKERYPTLNIRLIQPSLTLEEQANRYGEALWKHHPDRCCYLRKIVPLERILEKKAAWISGLRREQSPTRRNIQFINKDDRFRTVKVCPLIHWTADDIWTYIRLNALPYNELHDQGYPSIGCGPCTQPALGGSDSRSGRWANTGKTECGLHLPS